MNTHIPSLKEQAMCLSTVYKNKMEPQAVIMRNVMRIECRDGCIIFPT